MGRLSKLITDVAEAKANWVELLPTAIRQIHDIPGESGLSPYQIVLGRNRPYANLPYLPLREAHDATTWLAHMTTLRQTVADRLNALHEKRTEGVNKNRREPPTLAVGDKVWYRPERQPGTDKLEPKWKGPGVVASRVGDHSYLIELRPGARQPAHRSQLKPHTEDVYAGEPFPLYYLTGKAQELEATPDEWNVGSIDGHRLGPKGGLEFLVRWEDWDPSDRRWEPVESFFPRYNTLLVEYCRGKKIPLDLSVVLGGK
jgi:hypothetical protein